MFSFIAFWNLLEVFPADSTSMAHCNSSQALVKKSASNPTIVSWVWGHSSLDFWKAQPNFWTVSIIHIDRSRQIRNREYQGGHDVFCFQTGVSHGVLRISKSNHAWIDVSTWSEPVPQIDSTTIHHQKKGKNTSNTQPKTDWGEETALNIWLWSSTPCFVGVSCENFT